MEIPRRQGGRSSNQDMMVTRASTSVVLRLGFHPGLTAANSREAGWSMDRAHAAAAFSAIPGMRCTRITASRRHVDGGGARV